MGQQGRGDNGLFLDLVASHNTSEIVRRKKRGDLRTERIGVAPHYWPCCAHMPELGAWSLELGAWGFEL